MSERDPMAGEQAAPERGAEQRAAGDWPQPGEEGYVHPDGSPQSAQQMEANRRAAADRAAAGSIIHGAPVATNDVGDPTVAANAAVDRARAYSGPTVAENDQGVTDFVANAVAQATGADSAPVQAGKPSPRTADDSKPKQAR